MLSNNLIINCDPNLSILWLRNMDPYFDWHRLIIRCYTVAEMAFLYEIEQIQRRLDESLAIQINKHLVYIRHYYMQYTKHVAICYFNRMMYI